MSNTAETVEAPRRKLAVDEEGIAFLGQAGRGPEIDSGLLVQTPARDLSMALAGLVDRLRTLNVASLLRHQGVWGRLTGADIEARLRFELDVREITQEIRALDVRAGEARRTRQALQRTRSDIVAHQDWLAGLITTARRVLARTGPADAGNDPRNDLQSAVMLRERFERRLLNLSTLETSNLLTVEQITLADANLAQMVDRIDDIAGTVFTLWQRDAMALAQSAVPPGKASPLAAAFIRSHDALLAKLSSQPPVASNPVASNPLVPNPPVPDSLKGRTPQ